MRRTSVLLLTVMLFVLALAQPVAVVAATVGTTIAASNGTVTQPRLYGVSHSGPEYMCVRGVGIFDGPNNNALVTGIASWHVNTVRIPLNEDCWLGINGVNPSYSGQAYRDAIHQYVTRLHAYQIAVILELHWSAPGTAKALGQQVMADADHSIDFWRSVATAYQSDTAAMFELYNEAHGISWQCWRDGGTCDGVSFVVAGMQQLVDAVRATGAKNPLLLGGLNWSNDVSQWLTFQPHDPANNLMVAVHIYNFNPCNTVTCWDQTIAPLLGKIPVVVTEIGENDCAHGFIDTLMAWLDAHKLGYLAWAWNAWNCSTGPSLISGYEPTATAYGAGFRDHLATLASASASGTPVSIPAPPNTMPSWSDEFNNSNLDMGKWTSLVGGNFYTPPSLESYSANNVTFANGTLQIQSMQQSQNGFNYTSGGISSKGKFAFTYGTIAFRAKLPKGAGIWPALWLMPADGSSDFEMDVMEAVGQKPNDVFMTNHWRNSDGSYQDTGSTFFSGPDFSSDFHTFTLQWTPDQLTWLIDGQVRKTATSHIPTKAMFIYINTAIGALAGTPDAAAFPQTFAIDYVRVTPLAASQPISIAPVTGGQLVGTLHNPATTIDVSTEGISDWAAWSVTGDHDVEHKRTATERIGLLAIVGSDGGRQSGGGGIALTWRDGTTQVQGASNQKGIVVCGNGNGVSFTVPADTMPRTVRIYVNVWHGQGLLQTSLSDGSAVAYNDSTLLDDQSGQAGMFMVTYAAASAGQHLNIHWGSMGSGCVVLQVATLAQTTPTVTSTPPATATSVPPATIPAPLPTPLDTQPRPLPESNEYAPVLIIPADNALPIKGCVTWHIAALGYTEVLTVCKADT